MATAKTASTSITGRTAGTAPSTRLVPGAGKDFEDFAAHDGLQLITVGQPDRRDCFPVIDVPDVVGAFHVADHPALGESSGLRAGPPADAAVSLFSQRGQRGLALPELAAERAAQQLVDLAAEQRGHRPRAAVDTHVRDLASLVERENRRDLQDMAVHRAVVKGDEAVIADWERPVVPTRRASCTCRCASSSAKARMETPCSALTCLPICSPCSTARY